MDDNQKINLLAAFNFAFAGFIALVYAGLIVFMRYMPTTMPNFGEAESTLFAVALGVILVPAIAMHVLSGVFLRQRKFRIYCIVHAALQCLSFPFGTALGVYTIVVLNNESVQRQFDPVTYP